MPLPPWLEASSWVPPWPKHHHLRRSRAQILHPPETHTQNIRPHIQWHPHKPSRMNAGVPCHARLRLVGEDLGGSGEGPGVPRGRLLGDPRQQLLLIGAKVFQYFTTCMCAQGSCAVRQTLHTSTTLASITQGGGATRWHHLLLEGTLIREKEAGLESKET